MSRRSTSGGGNRRNACEQPNRHHRPFDRPDQSCIMVSCSSDDEEEGTCTSFRLLRNDTFLSS